MLVNRVKLDGDFHKLGFKEGFICISYKYDSERPMPWFITFVDWVCFGLMAQMFISAMVDDKPFLGTLAYAVGAAIGLKLYWDYHVCSQWRLLQMLRRMS